MSIFESESKSECDLYSKGWSEDLTLDLSELYSSMSSEFES